MLFMKLVTFNMLLGSEQVYVTTKLYNSYYSIFLTCTSFHTPIETLSNMLIVATKNVVTKIIYDIYSITNHVQASTSIGLKTAFVFVLFF